MPPATPLDRPVLLHSHFHRPPPPTITTTRMVAVADPSLYRPPRRGHSPPTSTPSRPLLFLTTVPQAHPPSSDAIPSTAGNTLLHPSIPPDIHGLPFLDLHYYSGSDAHDGNHHESGSGSADTSRQGQALDLARTHASLRSAPTTTSAVAAAAAQGQR